jgi:hypothetical protein
MDEEGARTIAERLHAHDRQEDGTPLLDHVRRVVAAVPARARPVAWLHEALEWTPVTEQELLVAGLTDEELRALRLLTRTNSSADDAVYLAHVRMIARAAGEAGRLARTVKVADLFERRAHPHVRRSGWSPPYARALELLRDGVTAAGALPGDRAAAG